MDHPQRTRANCNTPADRLFAIFPANAAVASGIHLGLNILMCPSFSFMNSPCGLELSVYINEDLNPNIRDVKFFRQLWGQDIT